MATKARTIAVATIAAFGITSVAVAQNNQYEVTGKTTVNGGTKKKPKPTGLSFGFKTSAPGSVLPAPIEKYSIGFEGTTFDTSVVKATCTAESMTRAQSDGGCSKKAVIGSGTINSLVGTTGQPTANAAKCDLKLTLYNSGKNKAALWLKGGPPTCIASINQAIEAKWVKRPFGGALEFSVPESLRHQLGLDIAVTNVTSSVKKIQATKKKGGKKVKVGYLSTIGCKDKKRDLIVTFTDETGASVPVKETLNKC